MNFTASGFKNQRPVITHKNVTAMTRNKGVEYAQKTYYTYH